MANEPLSNPRPRVNYGRGRTSEPQGFSPYANGGFGVIPRRGNVYDLSSCENVGRLAVGSPLRLLKILVDLHPMLGLAVWNALRLANAPEDLTISAVSPGAKAEDVDPEGTAALNALWDSLPNEVGGLIGLMNQLLQECMFTGLVTLEAVPGGRGQGVARIWPVDSLTVAFRRQRSANPYEDGLLLPLQRQLMPNQQPKYQGYTELNPDTFFWRTIDAMVDEPYGRAPLATAVSEILADYALLRDLRDAVHNAAWPRNAYGFNFVETHKIAVEVYGKKEPEASQWVQERFDELVRAFNNLKPDDSIFYDSAGDVKNLTPGDGFQAITGVLQFLRQRIVQGVKSLPTLMGINDGSTQTYTTVEWAIYAAGLESMREVAIYPVLKAATLHLQLLGMPLKAVATWKKIRTTDDKIEAQARTIQIANEKELVRLGMKSLEEASVALTGSGPVGPPLPGAFDAPKTASADPEADPAKDEEPNPAGA